MFAFWKGFLLHLIDSTLKRTSFQDLVKKGFIFSSQPFLLRLFLIINTTAERRERVTFPCSDSKIDISQQPRQKIGIHSASVITGKYSSYKIKLALIYIRSSSTSTFMCIALSQILIRTYVDMLLMYIQSFLQVCCLVRQSGLKKLSCGPTYKKKDEE